MTIPGLYIDIHVYTKCKTLGVNTAHAWKTTRFSEGAMAMASPMHVGITDSIVSDVCKVRVSKMISTCIMYVVQAVPVACYNLH